MKEISRLRVKFMLYNMVMVTVILSAAFFGSAFLIKSRIMKQSNAFLSRAVKQETEPLIFGAVSQVRVPYFTISIDQDGGILLKEGAYNSFPSHDFLERIAWEGLYGINETGDLEEYNLRYLRVSHPWGYTIAFIDTSYEDSIGGSMLKTLMIIGGAVWLCLLALSYFFSRWAVRPVEESVQMQKQFVADASHELKTPLTVIMANTQLLKERCDGIAPEIDKWIYNVHQESQDMRELVEQLLLLAKSEVCLQGKSRKEECSLSDLVTEGILTFEAVFYQNGKTLEYEITDKINLKADQRQIHQLIKILLDNAVKHSGQQGKTRVILERISKHRARLWVNSEGNEIPQEKRKEIFRRFYRIDTVRRGQNGYGLGLAIAQGIAENHSTAIGIEYQNGMNCFYINFRIT